jgi:hypothetical protein
MLHVKPAQRVAMRMLHVKRSELEVLARIL